MLMVPLVQRSTIYIYTFDPLLLLLGLVATIRIGLPRLIQKWKKICLGKFQISVVDVLLLSLLGWSLVSVLFSVNPSESINFWLLFFRGVVFYLYLRANFGTIVRYQDIRHIIIFLLFVESIIALIQFVTGSRLGSLNDLFGAREIYANAYFYTPFGRVIRVVGTFHNPNLLANWILALSSFLWSEIYLGVSPFKKMYVFLLGLSTMSLLFTFSRSAWATLLFMMAIIVFRTIFLSRRQTMKSLRALVAYGVVLIGTLVVAFLLINQFWSDAGFSIIQSRLANIGGGEEWRAAYIDLAFQLVRHFPLTGVGIGGFAEAINASIRQIEISSVLADAERFSMVHNVYLLFFAETGIPGGILWLSLTLIVWVCAWFSFEKRMPARLQVISLWLLAAWTGIAFNGNFEAVFLHQSIHMLIFAVMGLIVAQAKAITAYKSYVRAIYRI
jgi:O-antigen ligase